MAKQLRYRFELQRVPGIDVKGVGSSVVFVVVRQSRNHRRKDLHVSQPQLHDRERKKDVKPEDYNSGSYKHDSTAMRLQFDGVTTIPRPGYDDKNVSYRKEIASQHSWSILQKFSSHLI